MITYWHRHPRGFANECSLARAETDQEAIDLQTQGYTRLSRKAPARHIRWVNAENAAWGSNRAFGPICLIDVLSAPDYATWAVLAGV